MAEFPAQKGGRAEGGAVGLKTGKTGLCLWVVFPCGLEAFASPAVETDVEFVRGSDGGV